MVQPETALVSHFKQRENVSCIDGDDDRSGSKIAEECTSFESSCKKKKVVKRAGDAEEGILKPVKLSKSELYKPPTNEELNTLKETENLFHSSLLRMQIEELLKEVRLKEKRRKCIDSFLHEVKNLLSNIPETSVTDVTDQSWLPSDVKVPLLQVPYKVKGKFCFIPPSSVKIVGSYLLDTCVKPDINVDVAITMPKEILQDKDNLNQRYHRKRALYLSHIAFYLAKNELFECVKFGYMNSNHLKPVLLLKPKGKDMKLVTVRILACAPQGFFKFIRFLPSKNNIRSAWFMEQNLPPEGVNDPPTPHYNNSVLTDLVLEQHLHFLFNAATDFPGMKDGIAILRVWLRQRELDKGFGSFSGFIASMLVAYLVSKHKINKMMSGYQILRNVLQFLATTDLTANGITMAQSKDDAMPSLAEFHQAFEVVMVDSSGYVNLCAEMTASKYKQVQFEAKQSMEILDDKTTDGFQMLLMTPKPFIRTFDHVFFVKSVVKLQGTCKKMNLLNEMMDHGGNYVVAALPYILSVLLRGLGQRVQLMSHSLIQTPEWSISEDPPKHKDIKYLTFGLLLNSEFCTSILDRGPQADNTEAVEFRAFWGKKSELRRFQDGAICEAVVWQAETMFEKRLIQEQVIQHLLQLHADIPRSSLSYVGGLLDSIIKIKDQPAGTGEEEILTRSMWRCCQRSSSALQRPFFANAGRGIPSLSCGCGGLHTEGDKAFAEFLNDEIKEEKKIQKNKSLPKVSGGWDLELNGTEAKLIRKVAGEKISVTFNINNSIPPTFDDEPEEGQKGQEEKEPEIVSTPNFVVEVVKEAPNQTLVFDCHYPDDEVGHGTEEEDGDVFAIREVSFQPAGDSDWKDTNYTLNTDSLDWALYDHLMDFLADRGIDNTFADELTELSTALEHQEYIKFLEDLKSFIKCQ